MRNLFTESGNPRYLRIYDNGGATLFTRKRITNGRDSWFMHTGASETGAGFYLHGESDEPLDRNGYAHLGKPLKFADLAEPLRRRLSDDYNDLWGVAPAEQR